MKVFVGVMCLGLAVFAAGTLRAAEPMTMQVAVTEGLQANPSLQAAREALLASDYAIKAAQASFGPSMSTQYAYTRLDREPRSYGAIAGTKDNWTLSFNVYQPLFTGFNLLSTYQKSVLQKEQIGSQIDKAELELVSSIQDTFLQLLQAREGVRSAEDSLERLQSHLKVNTSFFEVGLRPKLDVLQAEVNVAQAEQALVAAQNKVGTLTAQMNTLLGKGAVDDAEYIGALAYFPIPLSLEDCLQRAGANRPDLRIAKQSIMLAEKDTTLAKVPFYPQVGAEFTYSREGENAMVDGGPYHTPSSWQAQVGMKWTFFEWGKTYYGVKQSQKNETRLMKEYHNLENQAAFEVKKNYLSIQDAEKRIAAAKHGLAAAKESLRMANARYEAQVGTNTDVLDALAAQTESEASLTGALADYERAVVGLYAAMGEKNPELLPR